MTEENKNDVNEPKIEVTKEEKVETEVSEVQKKDDVIKKVILKSRALSIPVFWSVPTPALVRISETNPPAFIIPPANAPADPN